MHFFINLQKRNELPADYQAVLTTAPSYANVDMPARYDAFNAVRCDPVAAGAQLKPFPQDVMEAGLAAAIDIHDQLAADNADFKTIYHSQRRSERGYLLFQVADHTYDGFMIRNRSKGSKRPLTKPPLRGPPPLQLTISSSLFT